jgi:hypothetical protein
VPFELNCTAIAVYSRKFVWTRICILQVNGVDMSSISHAEAVAFLRRCPDTVTIRLFRDSAVTPLSPLSPTEPELVGLNRPRPLLRY